MDFDFFSVEKDNFLLVDHPVADIDPFLDNLMTPDDGYMFRDSLQTIEMLMASPSSIGPARENSPWNLIGSDSGESVWDLSGLHPDPCSISGRKNSEPVNCSSASTPKTKSHGKPTPI